MLTASPARRAVRTTAAGLAALLVLAGCGTAGGSGDVPADRQVVAAFYPLAWVAERVAEGTAYRVSNLAEAGAEPHGLEPTVRETAQVAEAALVIHLGGFQPAVDEVVESNAGGTVLDAADVVALRPAEPGHHDDDGEVSREHDHEHDELDPHFWLDPIRMARLGDAVADTLAELDPEHAEEFRDNAMALRADLEALDAAYREGLAGCTRSTVVVSHDAFGYLARYGLDFEPVAGLSPGAEPTPADLQRLHRVIRERGITTVFSERLVSSRLTRALASDLGVETAVLDPLEGLTQATADEGYLSLMRANLAALEEANGC